MLTKIIAWSFLVLATMLSLGIIIAVAELPWGNQIIKTITPIIITNNNQDN